MNLKELKQLKIADLAAMARDMNVENSAGLRKQELIFAMLNAQAAKNEPIFGEGVLEILPDGFGFLRAPDYNYHARPGRHLRLPEPDPPLRPADGRHDHRSDPAPEGVGALLRAAQGRDDQLRGARGREEQDPLRQPDAAVSGP
jgi:hypothetical protein